MSVTTPTPSAVEVAIEEQVATVTLNRPEVRNAIDDAMRAELIAALDRLGSDDAVRAIVITGKGKAFCAGGDISGMQQRLNAPPGEIAFNGWRRQKRTAPRQASVQSRGRPHALGAITHHEAPVGPLAPHVRLSLGREEPMEAPVDGRGDERLCTHRDGGHSQRLANVAPSEVSGMHHRCG